MSGTFQMPRCARCGAETFALRKNTLIGGFYCAKCEAHIEKPDPKLEERYNRRVAARAAKETI